MLPYKSEITLSRTVKDHWLCYNFAKRLHYTIIILAEGSSPELPVQASYAILPTTNILKDADYLTSA